MTLQARQAALSTTVARLLVQNNESRGADRAAGPEHLRGRPAPGVLAPYGDAGRDRGHGPVPDPIEPEAVRAALGAVGQAARSGAGADRDARVHAARDRAGAARRVRADPDGDRIDARPGGQSRRRMDRRCGRTCARSARSRRRRSTTCAASRRRSTRRSSKSWDSRARSSGICPRPVSSSASRSRTSRPARRRDRSARPGFTCIACCRKRSATSRGTPGRSARGCGCAATPTGCELEVEDHGKGLDPATPPRGLGLVAMRERVELLKGSLEFLRAARRAARSYASAFRSRLRQRI